MCSLDFLISDVARHHQIALPKNNCVRSRWQTSYDVRLCFSIRLVVYHEKARDPLTKKSKIRATPPHSKKGDWKSCMFIFFLGWKHNPNAFELTENGYFFSKPKLRFGQFLEIRRVHRTVMNLQSFSDLYEFHIHLPWLYWHLWMNNLEIKE